MPKPVKSRKKTARKLSVKPVQKGVKAQPLRFAHPYYTADTTVPPATRTPHPLYGRRMLDHVVQKLAPIPKAKNDRPLSLQDIIGAEAAAEIQKSGKICFHIGGDSGIPDLLDRETRQSMVAAAMTGDYGIADPATCPAFLYHVGDVIYTAAKGNYLTEFYAPYKHYPGKIVAIPGNHDGDVPGKIDDFQKFFCAPGQVVPKEAGSIFRQTMNQPGVYWMLDAPFVQIIGLYSNCAENPGFISGAIPGSHQKKWLVDTLKQIASDRQKGVRKALLITTHHPPYASAGHSGSADMLQDIDDACHQAGVMPDAHVSGHAHSIQRYTRRHSSGSEIPYLIYGCLGHGGQVIAAGFPKTENGVTYEFAHKGWGYGLVEVTAQTLKFTSYGVDWDKDQKAVKTVVDAVTVNLATRTVSGSHPHGAGGA